MSIKRHLTAYLHRSRCDRSTLLPLVEKMSEREAQALWQLLQSKDRENQGLRRVGTRGY